MSDLSRCGSTQLHRLHSISIHDDAVMLEGERDWAPVELHHLDACRQDRTRVLESRRSQLANLDVRRHAAFGLVTLVGREVLLVGKQGVECLGLVDDGVDIAILEDERNGKLLVLGLVQ